MTGTTPESRGDERQADMPSGRLNPYEATDTAAAPVRRPLRQWMIVGLSAIVRISGWAAMGNALERCLQAVLAIGMIGAALSVTRLRIPFPLLTLPGFGAALFSTAAVLSRFYTQGGMAATDQIRGKVWGIALIGLFFGGTAGVAVHFIRLIADRYQQSEHVPDEE